jgi:hypothetical protein
MHECFDVPFQERASNDWIWFRYVDNVYVLTGTQNAAEDACRLIQETLRETEFSLHGPTVTSLNSGGSTEVLGLGVSLVGNRIHFSPPAKTPQHLRGLLSHGWFQQSPGEFVSNVIEGWIQSLGPCCETWSVGNVLETVRYLLSVYGFDEAVPEGDLEEWVSQSRSRWHTFSRRRRNLLNGERNDRGRRRDERGISALRSH